MRSRNILTRQINPIILSGSKSYKLLQCKGGGHWRVVWVAITNTHGSATLSGFLELWHKGILYYLDATGTIGAYGMKVWTEALFLVDGDELAVSLATSTGVINGQIVVQALHFNDTK